MWRTITPVPPVYASRGPEGRYGESLQRRALATRKRERTTTGSSLAVASEFFSLL
jgi:hypothetical protein